MPLHSDQNLYPGINPHLNSTIQNEPGEWESFHNDHITNIREHLDVNLPPGYLARTEKSLQISEIPLLPGSRPSRTRPDVTIIRSHSTTRRVGPTEPLTATAPVATLLLSQLLTDEDFLRGLVIYQVGEGGPLGRPITRIELLSPSNKPGGSHHGQYNAETL